MPSEKNSRFVHYLSFYHNEAEISGRKKEIAAQQKVRYISSCILKCGEKLKIVSTALPDATAGLFAPRKSVYISEKEEHIYLSALHPKTRLTGLYLKLVTTLYLLFCVRKNDCVIVYHSPSYFLPLRIFKAFKKNFLVLEFNDLYHLLFTDAKIGKRIQKKEKKLLNLPDGFILASPFMRELISEKKNIVNYGSYAVSHNDAGAQKTSYECLIIYTGIVETLRNGAFIVAESAGYLPEGYTVQIAGFGFPEDIAALKEKCNAVNQKAKRTVVEYIGCLNHNELSELMQKATLAINAHTYAEDEIWKSKYSFPSKIPLNMANGLFVVTYPYDIITTSPMKDACIYFDELTSESMAKAIVEGVDKITHTNVDPKAIITQLDKEFVSDLADLIST